MAEFAFGARLRKVRFEHESARQAHKDRAAKDYRWEHLVDGSWFSGDGGLSKPLYVNRAFLERDHAGVVVGFEGEAKADLAGESGIAAFSFKDITPEQAAGLNGCDVVIWPDHDKSGKKQADSAAHVILDAAHARSIKILTPPAEFPAAADIIDAVNDLKWDRESIFRFLETAAAYSDGDSLRPAASDPNGSGSATGSEPDPGRAGVNATRGFRLTDDAVIFIDSEKKSWKICGRLEIAALTRDSKGDWWGRLLIWIDAEGRVHRWAMPMSLLAGDGTEYRARLLDGGLGISSGKRARALLSTYIQSTRVQTRALCVPRVGWHGDAFVLPEGTIGAGTTEEVLFQTPNESEHLLNVSGTVEDWRTHVGRLCSGNSRLLLTVSCAFAGPLLSLAGEESGGIHLVGKSSEGKTTGLVVGGSVNGGGRRNGFLQSWRVTSNGLEAVAELHNDLTLFLDELAQVDPREAAETAYLLANGSGKTRMSRSIGARKKLTWTLLFVSSGEVTLTDHALTAGKRTRGGAEVRLVNVEADAGAGLGLFENIHGAESPDAFSKQLTYAAKRFYGAPIREFLARVARDRVSVEKAIQNFRAAWVKRNVPPGASGEVSRAAYRFALIGFAGEFATDTGITGWKEEEATRAAESCFANWLSHRVGGAGAFDEEAAVRQVRNFIEVNGASRFQPSKVRRGMDGDLIPEKVINRAGFRVDQKNGDAVEYLILPGVFQNDVCQGYDYRMVANALLKRGYLVNQPPHLTKKTPMPEVGNIRFYAVNASILGE